MTSTSPTSPASDPRLAGRELAGRYRLRAAIASGGMAQVWEADDLVLGRRVAVKLLHPHLTSDPSFVARFRNEAKAAARLTNPSIVSIFDTASDGDIEAIVMERIDGMTLRQFLDDYGPLSLEDATDLTTQVADALDAAHAAQIVHRDIKPGNIMLCPDRRVKVTDFGIAKALEGGDHTQQGTLLGTAKYLAPEQVQGDDVDARADIYALGVVLYESLTGEPPFNEATDSATALARLQRDPLPPRRLRPEIPGAVERVILRALARKRDDRFPSAVAMRDALVAAAAAPPEPVVDATTPIGDPTTPMPTAPAPSPSPSAGPDAPPGDRPPRRWVRPLLVLLLILGSLALALVLIFDTDPGQDFLDDVRADDDSDGGTTADAAIGEADPAEDSTTTDAAPPPADEDTDTPPPVTDTVQAADFDPEGDGAEHPERVANLIDGDRSSTWISESYDNRKLGNLKPGVGVTVTLHEAANLDELTVITANNDWAASVFVAVDTPDSLDGWGDPVDQQEGLEGDATFDLRGVRGSSVLVWITDLGDGPPLVKMEIAELELSSS